MAARPFAILVELTQRTVADGKRMPLAGPDPLVGDVSGRELCANHLLRIEAFDDAVHDSLRAEIFRAVDAEIEFGARLAVDHVLGQEIFWAEAEIAIILRDDVHWRRADEGGDEAGGGVVVDLRRFPDLPHPPTI